MDGDHLAVCDPDRPRLELGSEWSRLDRIAMSSGHRFLSILRSVFGARPTGHVGA